MCSDLHVNRELVTIFGGYSFYSLNGGLELNNNILYYKTDFMQKKSQFTILKDYDLLILFLYTIGYVLELQTKYLCWNEEEIFTGRQMKSTL